MANVVGTHRPCDGQRKLICSLIWSRWTEDFVSPSAAAGEEVRHQRVCPLFLVERTTATSTLVCEMASGRRALSASPLSASIP